MVVSSLERMDCEKPVKKMNCMDLYGACKCFRDCEGQIKLFYLQSVAVV